MFLDCGNDPFDDIVMPAAPAADSDVSFGVRIAPFICQSLKRRFRVVRAKQRPRVAPGGAFAEDIDRRVEPDGDRAAIQQFASSGIDERATAGRDHADGTIDQPRDQTTLAIPKIAFPKSLEYFSCGEASCILDCRIAVYEGQPKAFRQAAANGGLAGAHQANEDDRSIKALGQLFHDAGLYIGFDGRAKGLRPLNRTGISMPRFALVLLFLLLLLGGLLYFLSSSVDEVPQTVIEQNVAANAGT